MATLKILHLNMPFLRIIIKTSNPYPEIPSNLKQETRYATQT